MTYVLATAKNAYSHAAVRDFSRITDEALEVASACILQLNVKSECNGHTTMGNENSPCSMRLSVRQLWSGVDSTTYFFVKRMAHTAYAVRARIEALRAIGEVHPQA